MIAVTLSHPADFDGWRAEARRLLANGVLPEQVVWRVPGDAADLLASPSTPPAPKPAASPPPPPFTVPRAFLDLARDAAANRNPERFALLYALLTRLCANRFLLDDTADPQVFRLGAFAKGVRRDVHKMRAFVRFRSLDAEVGERFVAWFEPEHHIVRLNSDFFVRRFASMRWSILTPLECVHWDGEEPRFTPGATRQEAPDGDDLEATWKTYYAAIFNPARLKVGAMLKEMPKKYWRNMPETALVQELIATAGAREQRMIEAAGTPAPAPAAAGAGAAAVTLADLKVAARLCTRCPLYASANQVVFGEGPPDAPLMLVGEQPGDTEDIAGRPFVGPAGQVLDRALGAAGIDRAAAYVTNAVKHFKFEQRGRRRIHAKPDVSEIDACRWWIEQERAILRPRLTVALGATAARSLTGRAVTISRERGRPFALADGGLGFITIHPSFILRIEDKAAADAEFDRFVADLAAARALAKDALP